MLPPWKHKAVDLIISVTHDRIVTQWSEYNVDPVKRAFLDHTRKANRQKHFTKMREMQKSGETAILTTGATGVTRRTSFRRKGLFSVVKVAYSKKGLKKSIKHFFPVEVKSQVDISPQRGCSPVQSDQSSCCWARPRRRAAMEGERFSRLTS